jgi:hypothetical protein
MYVYAMDITKEKKEERNWAEIDDSHSVIQINHFLSFMMLFMTCGAEVTT